MHARMTDKFNLDHGPRLCRETPSSARERAVFSTGKDGEAGDVGFIVDAARRKKGRSKPDRVFRQNLVRLPALRSLSAPADESERTLQGHDVGFNTIN